MAARGESLAGPISPAPVLGGGRKELPAYISNGVMGLRIREIPLFSGIAILSGYSGEHPVEHIESAARVPFPLEGKLTLNGVLLSDVTYLVREIEQSYDFATAELRSTFSFAIEGAAVRVNVLTFCSRSHPTLACQQIEIQADGKCSVVLSAGIDTRAIEGQKARLVKEVDGCDGLIRWESSGGLSACGLAYTTAITEGVDAERSVAERDDQLTTHYSFEAKPGSAYRLTQMTSVVPSIMHAQPELQSARLVGLARQTGFDAIRSANRREWEKLWKSRIRLIGADPKWQHLADAALFYLNTSTHGSSPASTSIFGLSTWKDYHYYYGHVMWDIEAFALPVLSLVQPHAAKAVLEYRFRSIGSARKNAQMRGRRGLQFPWHSGSRSGEEAAPLPGSAAWYEDHVTVDVALAFATHAELTGDAQFLKERAWPVIQGVAEWIESRVTKTARGFEIKQSMGIAERKEPCDNPAFTNMAAKVLLRKAIEAGKALGVSTSPKWAEIADGLVLARRDAVIVSHDGYDPKEEKGATPDPLMGFFPTWFAASPAEERSTLSFYLERAGEYIGSPMLSALYGVWAAWAEDRELSAKLLEDGYGTFAAGRFTQILEYRPDRFPEQPQAGPFFANMSGFLLGLLLGFSGIRPSGDTIESWPCRQVVLPAGWEAIEVDELWMRGQQVRVRAVHGAERASLIPITA